MLKRSVIIPTYPGHFSANEKFLGTLSRFGREPEGIIFRFILGHEEEARALSRLPAFLRARERFDIAAVALPEVLRMAGAEPALIARATLERMGDRFSYQSLKKVAGLLAFAAEESLLLDSECRLLRPTSFHELFDRFFAAPVIFFSRQNAPRLAGVNDASLTLLSPDGLEEAHQRWIFEYQGWFYRRAALLAFAEHVREARGHSVLQALVETPNVYETISYNWFLYRHPEHFPGGRFVEAEEAMRAVFGEREGDAILRIFAGRACGIVEHLLAPLTLRRFRGYQRFIRRFGLQMLRVELGHAGYNLPLVWLFLRRTPEIRMLVCSDGWAGLSGIIRRNLDRVARLLRLPGANR